MEIINVFIVERTHDAGQRSIEFEQSEKREHEGRAATGERQVREQTAHPLGRSHLRHPVGQKHVEFTR